MSLLLCSKLLVVVYHLLAQDLASLLEQLFQSRDRCVPGAEVTHQDLLAFVERGDQVSFVHVFSAVGDDGPHQELFSILLAKSDDEECVGIVRIDHAVVLFGKVSVV